METPTQSPPTRKRPAGPLGWLLNHLKRRWLLYAGLAISAFFLYRIFTEMWANLGQVWDQLRQANYWWVIPGVAVYFFGVWARTWRWHYMLRPIQKVPLTRLFPIVCIGYMGNNVYPYRAGEVLRAYALRKKEGVSISASLATILAERVFDGIVMLMFVFLGLPFFPGIPADWRRWVIIFTLAFFGALVVFFLIAVSPQRTRALYTWLFQRVLPERFRGPVQDIADRFVEGLRCLRSPRDLGMIFVTSVVVWLAETVKYWFVMHAFPFVVPFYILMLMNGVVNLFTTLPAAPGYFGTFDWPGIKVLTTYLGESMMPTAAAYTFALHLALWFPITILGAYYSFRMRKDLAWDQAREEVQRERAQETALAADGEERAP